MNLFKISLLVLSLSLAHANDNILVLIPQDVLIDYDKFLSGRNPIDIKNYSGPHSRRDVIETVLLQQALYHGGFKSEIKFVAINSYKRTIQQLSSGEAALGATSVWKRDILPLTSTLDTSMVLIKKGEFEAGIYTSPQNIKALQSNTLDKIKSLNFVSSENWTLDWTTLKNLNLEFLYSTSSWGSMVKMVQMQRADVLLAPFSQEKSLQIKVDSTLLLPIPGYKIGLDGSRHFVISKKNEHYLSIKSALSKGMIYLRRNKKIHKAFEQCGFFNKKVKNWKWLN